MKLTCRDFQVRSATIGHDAQGEVTVEIEHRGRHFHGTGFSTDTVEATLRAVLSVLNNIVNLEPGAVKLPENAGV